MSLSQTLRGLTTVVVKHYIKDLNVDMQHYTNTLNVDMQQLILYKYTLQASMGLKKTRGSRNEQAQPPDRKLLESDAQNSLKGWSGSHEAMLGGAPGRVGLAGILMGGGGDH